MEKYNHIGELLLEVRRSEKKTQADMAEMLEIDERTYRRWEKNNNHIADSKIEDIVDKIKVPFEVLLRLNHDFPTFFDIKTRRYSLCPFDRDFVNKKILQQELGNSKETGNIEPLKKSSNYIKSKRIDFPIYPYKKELDPNTIHRSALVLPELNVIIYDPKGHYSGHMISIPIKSEVFARLECGELQEFQLSPKDVVEINPKQPTSIHIFSFFSTTTTYTYCLAKRLVLFLVSSVPNKLHKESIISRYPVTKDGIEFCYKFGMEKVGVSFDDYYDYSIDITPIFFKIKINKIKWLDNYKNIDW